VVPCSRPDRCSSQGGGAIFVQKEGSMRTEDCSFSNNE
jgi:hypothetical protein